MLSATVIDHLLQKWFQNVELNKISVGTAGESLKTSPLKIENNDGPQI